MEEEQLSGYRVGISLGEKDKNCCNIRALEDISNISFQVAELGSVNHVGGHEEQRDDEVVVDLENLTSQQLGKSKGSRRGSSSNIIHEQLGNKDVVVKIREERASSGESPSILNRKKQKFHEQKIRLMYDIQDRILTVKKKEKGDRTLRRQKGKKIQLERDILELKNSLDSPWIIGGDVNGFRPSLDGRLGAVRSLRSIVNKNVILWKPPSLGWMKFSVAGVIMEDEAGSGGVLRDNKGVAYAMFSRLIEATGSGKAEVRAIKIVVEMFMSMGWHEKVPLVIESSSSVVLEWLLDRSYRSWMLRNLFIGIDYDINLLLRAQFAIIQ
ncbi:hypothetical protein J1N35_028379 [Gossypium stocksii]|uniref:RNase H type-1 domain-containing protein n=1 Tax=Gossypium stocksii TaxID=47602 RepID=A0A9D3UVV2_9ROSI|nr:hypothetical protein J1N35_028379 [Gossypium stocksii]